MCEPRLRGTESSIFGRGGEQSSWRYGRTNPEDEGSDLGITCGKYVLVPTSYDVKKTASVLLLMMINEMMMVRS